MTRKDLKMRTVTSKRLQKRRKKKRERERTKRAHTLLPRDAHCAEKLSGIISETLASKGSV